MAGGMNARRVWEGESNFLVGLLVMVDIFGVSSVVLE